jgi:exoribonuclease R
MLLTNIAVAQQIAVALPEQALLRRHDAPIDRRLVSPTTASYIRQTNEITEFASRKSGASWVHA